MVIVEERLKSIHRISNNCYVLAKFSRKKPVQGFFVKYCMAAQNVRLSVETKNLRYAESLWPGYMTGPKSKCEIPAVSISKEDVDDS